MPGTYKIGEAAALLNLKTYVLRFWETEFPQIAPLRTETGRRVYTEDHLALLERIRFLLHERGLTIDGARRILAEEAAKGASYALPAALIRRGEDAAPFPGAGPGADPDMSAEVDPALFAAPPISQSPQSPQFLPSPQSRGDDPQTGAGRLSPSPQEAAGPAGRPETDAGAGAFLREIGAELERVAAILAGRGDFPA